MSNLRKRLATRVEPKRVEVTDTYETGLMVPDLTEGGNPRLDKATKEPILKAEEVTDTYVLLGMPDDYTLTIGLMGDQEQAKQAALYNAHLADRWKDDPESKPLPFTKDDVYKVKLVAHYLQPDEGEAASEYDIAMLAKEHGPLFTRMFVEAVKIANNKTGARVGDQEVEDPTVTVGLGNSSSAETGN